MTFSLLNRTSAEAKPFPNVNAKFMAQLKKNTTDEILVSNSVHSLCPTTLRKISKPISAGASTTASFGLLTALAVAALLARR